MEINAMKTTTMDGFVEKPIQKTADRNGNVQISPVQPEIGKKAINVDGNEKEKQFSEKALKSALESANNKMKGRTTTRCEFSVHKPTGRVSIKICDQETNEVIKEIPSEEALKMVEKLWELSGILLDEKR